MYRGQGADISGGTDGGSGNRKDQDRGQYVGRAEFSYCFERRAAVHRPGHDPERKCFYNRYGPWIQGNRQACHEAGKNICED